MSNSSIWPIDRTLSGATILGQSELGNDGNDEVLRITQSSSITEASPSDCLMSHSGYSLEESYPSAEMQSIYSAAPFDRASKERKLIFKVSLCSVKILSHTHTHTHTHIYSHIHMYVHSYIYIYIYVCVYVREFMKIS